MTTNDQADVRIAVGGENWTFIGSQLMLGLSGGRPAADEFQEREWLQSARADVVNPRDKRVAMSALWMLERDTADVAITSPPEAGYMARNALGCFHRPHDITAIGVLPHHDWMTFAVREDSEIKSLQDIADRELAVDLFRPPREYTDPKMNEINAFIVDEVLKQYGITDQRIQSWGGSVTYGARHRIDAIANGEADMIIDEAMMTPQWKEITDAVDLRYLDVDEDVINMLSETYGLAREEMPEGYLPGVDRNVPSISKSGWFIVAHERLRQEVGYNIARALDEKAERINEYFQKMTDDSFIKPPLTEPIDMNEVWKDTKIPLHPGVDKYYQDRGYK